MEPLSILFWGLMVLVLGAVVLAFCSALWFGGRELLDWHRNRL